MTEEYTPEIPIAIIVGLFVGAAITLATLYAHYRFTKYMDARDPFHQRPAPTASAKQDVRATATVDQSKPVDSVAGSQQRSAGEADYDVVPGPSDLFPLSESTRGSRTTGIKTIGSKTTGTIKMMPAAGAAPKINPATNKVNSAATKGIPTAPKGNSTATKGNPTAPKWIPTAPKLIAPAPKLFAPAPQLKPVAPKPRLMPPVAH